MWAPWRLLLDNSRGFRLSCAGRVKVGDRLIFIPEPSERFDRIRITINAQINVRKALAVGNEERCRDNRLKFPASRLSGSQRRNEACRQRSVRVAFEG